jgi:hypothetical protein
MPHAEQTFYKMRCGWATDPKVAALARFGAVDACLARDLFGQMIDYARRELTDGLVPADEIGRLAYPLPAPDAMRVAEQLTDPGPWGPLCSWHTAGNARGNTPGSALRILAYAKWNDTRAEVEARKEQGTKAARTRWDRADQGGNTGGNAGGIAPAIQRESKRKNPPSPPGDEQSGEQWSPSDSLNPPPARRGGGPRSRPVARPAAEIRAAARRPGGPASDPAAHAAEARRLLAERAVARDEALALDGAAALAVVADAEGEIPGARRGRRRIPVLTKGPHHARYQGDRATAERRG